MKTITKATFMNYLKNAATEEEVKLIKNNGYIAPKEVSEAVLTKMFAISPILGHIKALAIPSGTDFYCEDPTGAPVDGDITSMYKKLTLGGYFINKMGIASNKIFGMDSTTFEMFVSEILASPMALELEDYLINGAGTTEPTGLIKAGSGTSGAYVEGTDLKTIDAATTITDDDIIAWLKMVSNYNDLKIYMSRETFIDYFFPLMNSTNNLINIQNGQYHIMDIPVYHLNKTSKGIAYLADMHQMKANFPNSLQMMPNTSYAFRTGETAFMLRCTFDSKPVTGIGAFAKFVKAQA